MKKTISNIIYILIVTMLLASCNLSKCKSENSGLCELDQVKTFDIEKDAKVIIGVFNDGFGKEIVESWNNLNPDNLDMLSYELIQPENQEELLSHLSDYDLIQLNSEDVPLYYDSLSPFDESFSSILENESISKFASQINQEDNYFIPFDFEGLLFAYNKTMLKEFGVDLTDIDNNGLPEAIDSFEKINVLAKQWRVDNVTYLDQNIEEIFSFPLNDQLAMIPFFENSDYRLIQGVSAEMMNLEEDLLNALIQLQKLGSYKWKFDEKLENDMLWNYEEVLIDQSAPFLLVGNWMYYDYYQTSKAYELVFTKLPSLNEIDLASRSSVTGFVLNKDSKYPNAANKALKHIKGPEGIQVAANNGIIPIVNREILAVEGLEISNNLKQQINAYQYSEASPLQAFEQKPEKRGWDVYLENDFREVFKAVFLNKLTPVEGQNKIINIIKEWLNSQDIRVEGVNNEQLEKDN